jgi:predicted transposase YbfD/YdcC
MNYNTISAAIDEQCFNVGSLYEQFSKLHDGRERRGKQYPLALVLVFIVLAKLGGADTPYAMAQWVRWRLGKVARVLGWTREKLPSHNTYRRLLRLVDEGALQEVSNAFLQQAEGAGDSVLIAIDGKVMRGTIPSGESQGVHLLAAYLPAEGLVLMQVAVGNKEGELTAAPRLLETLDLRHKVVRGDALFTQRHLSAQIIEAGGDYLWPVKENQFDLLADIQEVFDPAPTAAGWSQTPRDLRSVHTTNSGHGRLERRTLTASSFLNEYSNWPGLAQVFKLECQVIVQRTGEIRRQTVYGVTSLTAADASPDRLLTLMRDYWGIENGLHYRRDKTLSEDAARISNPQQAHVLAIVNNLVVGLVKQQGFDNLAAARRFYNGNLAAAVRLVTSSHL